MAPMLGAAIWCPPNGQLYRPTVPTITWNWIGVPGPMSWQATSCTTTSYCGRPSQAAGDAGEQAAQKGR